MAPHKNMMNSCGTTKKNKFKPMVMVGDISKPNCEFTSDLNFMAHNTRLIKKMMAKDGGQESASLQQARLKERIKRRTKALI